MDQLSRNRLAQLQLSALLQLVKNPETKKLMKPEVKKALEGVTLLPESMIKSASFVIPDQPISALHKQEITVKKLLNWYSSPHGGQAWIEKAFLYEEAVNIMPAGGKCRQTENRAKNGLEFMTRFLNRAGSLVEKAKNHYETAEQRWREATCNKTVSREVITTAFQEMINEAANYGATTDFFALVSLHYQKYLNEVTTAGFEISAYKKIPNGNHPKYDTNERDRSLSFFTIPPNIMNNFDAFYASCNQLFCIANDEELKSHYGKTGKPLYPIYAYSVYSRLHAHMPDWVKKYFDEFTAKALQAAANSSFSSDATSWMVGFRESPDKNDTGGQARSPRRWKDEITRISVREEVLWREQESPGITRTQIFREVARDYGCSEENARDWFYEKTEKKSAARKQGRGKK